MFWSDIELLILGFHSPYYRKVLEIVSFDRQMSVIHNVLFLCDILNDRLAVIATRTRRESDRLRLAARYKC
jgi:hypothetical protein